ncbi:MAG: M23 family metallopeptidase [Clostridiales bacterium]
MMRSPFLDYARMTTPFKKPGSWSAGYHTGEDWVCDGDRTLVSPCNGTIISNKKDPSYGNMVIIRTNDNKVILMAHMKLRSPVVGKVKVGDYIGIMGNTGHSFGAHLHIEVENSANWGYNKNLLKPSDYIDFKNYDGVEKDNTEAEEMMYKKIGDVPQWARPAVQLRVDLGAIKDPKDMSVYESNLVDWIAFDRENPYYKNVKDVPNYWQADIKYLVDAGYILGDGTNQIAMRHSELKAIIVAKRIFDKKK